MAVDIGAEAIDRETAWSPERTLINKASPASNSGTITSIDIWAKSNITGLRVGTFYPTNGDTLKCRASQAIEGTITAGDLVNKVVSIAVVAGDYIGCYYDAGTIEADTSGFEGLWYIVGEAIDPNDEATYSTAYPTGAVSLGGYISVAGWTGKISGVTNPAKIMGVDVANIAKVKGVASA